ncbi:DUF3533 domain-containing protein [Nocardia puris]|uniref:YhgE/Pip domain-containing protein n=1 Tax=Nocardia puris TaxID=208602 RepID=UPI001895BA7F|nr:DUF3533 domain-containing protein [Nocardia puris]MBF6213247.1 DUF3533 domain-containing protein [Nocardia puris]MBF6369839.1 DUF3533 domain-containing protein [Nocardia puris]MBF6462126.1 DUF3533 domain-containing protein [Nocardia puris]
MKSRIFTAPLAVLLVFAGLLATMYLGYAGNTEKNLHGFPIALVNQDVGDVGPDGASRNVGAQVADALVAGIPSDKVDLRVLGLGPARAQLGSGEVYGAIVIPSDFTKRLSILGASAVVPGDVERPIITLYTNPRVGPFTTGITQRIADRALDQVNTTVGATLGEQVRAALPDRAAADMPGAARLVLADPVEVVTSPYRPMPDAAGEGLVAFFYALILLLAGFTGAMLIHTLTDSALGFTPTEYGPWFVHPPATGMSRFRTLLVKWAVAAVGAPILSGVFVGVATALDIPLGNGPLLWLYGTLAIFAVGCTALSVLAAFGTAGLMVNLIVFVVLGLPSSAGTIPLEATPEWIAKMAAFEPMHQIYLAVRTILFFDADWSAGLGQGLGMTLAGLLIGVALGVTATVGYDRWGWHRGAEAPRPPKSDTPEDSDTPDNAPNRRNRDELVAAT